MENKKYINLPLGIGGRELKEGSLELPAIHVDNEVLWVNEDMELPFKIEKGKPTNVVGFFTSAPEKNKKPIIKFEVHPSHKRSALISRVIFKDKQGNLYRDVDQKGGGYVRDAIVKEPVVIDESDESTFSASGPFGLCNLRCAILDKGMSEKFLKYGIRTYRVVAIVKLKKIIDETGNKITIKEAREKKFLRPIDNPVIEIRAYGTKMRIVDANNNYKFLEDGIRLVAQELGIDNESFTAPDYYNWFCVTLGKQVAKMHKNGYAHCYLSEHNITLDCRIVDLDSLIDFRNGKKFRKMTQRDKKDAVRSLELLFACIRFYSAKYEHKNIFPKEKFTKEMFDLGYNEIMKSF